jgi:hypothetical protein
LYLVLLPFWWYSLEAVSTVLAALSDPLYRLFDHNVSISSTDRLINVYVTAPADGDLGVMNHSSALKVDTVSYGLPLLIALVLATKSDSLFAKLRALALGLLTMLVISVPVVMIWAKLTSVQLDEQITLASARASQSSFLFYTFHGYAFSQPVVATGIWLAMLLLGLFKDRPRARAKKPESPAVILRNAPCVCGSGLKYKRCCGRA